MCAPVSGDRLACEYLSDTLTVLCDGNVTCGLDDPNGTRSYGNVKLSSVDAIWRDRRYGEREQRLAEGRSCDGCSLHRVAEGTVPERAPAPRRLIVEATVTCNIRCRNDACFKNNDPNEQTRASNFLPLDVFKSVLDQTASGVHFMWFLNYGEPFLHPQAEDMIAYAKQKNPAMRIASSTNGIPFARPGRAAKLVRSGVDHMTFTIAGIDQETYVRYHGRGSSRAALDGMRRVCEAKRELGRSTPVVHWRYLLFHWNDSADTIANVKALAADIGVDELRFYLTHIPAGGATRRLAFGSPDHHEIADLVDASHGMQPDDDGLYLREDQEHLGPYRWSAPTARVLLHARGRFASMALMRPPQTPEASVVVTLPWSELTTRAGDGSWASVRIFVPRRYRRSRLVATLATSPWYPVNEGHPDIRCLGVMVAAGEVGGGATTFFGGLAMKSPHLRERVRDAERRISARMRFLRARLAIRHHAR
jgi:MoaA/NifB/PqqE/SkfB family radical SAM enzyme